MRLQTEVHTTPKEMMSKNKFTTKEVPLNSSIVIDIEKSLDTGIEENSLNNRGLMFGEGSYRGRGLGGGPGGTFGVVGGGTNWRF